MGGNGGDRGREWGSGGEEVRLDEHQTEVTVEAHLEGGEGGQWGRNWWEFGVELQVIEEWGMGEGEGSLWSKGGNGGSEGE